MKTAHDNDWSQLDWQYVFDSAIRGLTDDQKQEVIRQARRLGLSPQTTLYQAIKKGLSRLMAEAKHAGKAHRGRRTA